MVKFGGILLIAALLLQVAQIQARNHLLSNYYMERICHGKHNVLLARHDSCTEFIICIDGQSIASTCGPNYHFNERYGHCDLPENVNCKLMRPGVMLEHAYKPDMSMLPSLQNENMVEHVLSNIPKPQYPEEIVTDISAGPICEGHRDGAVWPKTDSCDHYFICVLERPYRRTCPSLLHFNWRRGVCEAPELAMCDLTLVDGLDQNTANGFPNTRVIGSIETSIDALAEPVKESTLREDNSVEKLEVEEHDLGGRIIEALKGESSLITEIIHVPIVSKIDQSKQEVPFVTRKVIVKDANLEEEAVEEQIGVENQPLQQFNHKDPEIVVENSSNSQWNEFDQVEVIYKSPESEVQSTEIIDIPTTIQEIIAKPIQEKKEIVQESKAATINTKIDSYPKQNEEEIVGDHIKYGIGEEMPDIVKSSLMQQVQKEDTSSEAFGYATVTNNNNKKIAPVVMAKLVVNQASKNQEEVVAYEPAQYEPVYAEDQKSMTEPIGVQNSVVNNPINKQAKLAAYGPAHYVPINGDDQEAIAEPIGVLNSVMVIPIDKQDTVVAYEPPQHVPVHGENQKVIAESIGVLNSVVNNPIAKQEKIAAYDPAQYVPVYGEDQDAVAQPIDVQNSVVKSPIVMQEKVAAYDSAQYVPVYGEDLEPIAELTDVQNSVVKSPIVMQEKVAAYDSAHYVPVYGEDLEAIAEPTDVQNSVVMSPIVMQEKVAAYDSAHYVPVYGEDPEAIAEPIGVQNSVVKSPIVMQEKVVAYDSAHYVPVYGEDQEASIHPIGMNNFVVKQPIPNTLNANTVEYTSNGNADKAQDFSAKVVITPPFQAKPVAAANYEPTEFETLHRQDKEKAVDINKYPAMPIQTTFYESQDYEGTYDQEKSAILIKKKLTQQPITNGNDYNTYERIQDQSKVATSISAVSQKQPLPKEAILKNQLPRLEVETPKDKFVTPPRDMQKELVQAHKQYIANHVPVASKEDSGICTDLPNGTMLPHRFDCSKYFLCGDALASSRICAYGQHFNRIQQRCDDPEFARCEL